MPIVRSPLAALAALAVVSLATLGACRRPPPARHLLLVTLDTFRADRVGAYGHPGGLTPNLDRLAREGIRFEAAWSVAPLTLPAHASLFTGRLPVAHGVRQNGAGALGAEEETLATRLAAAGFRTAAFVGAFVLNHRYGLARGFDTYDDEIAQVPGRPTGIEAQRSGREVVDRALAWLSGAGSGALDRRFFLWVHLFDAHAPYEPPEPSRSRSVSPYDGEIAETDDQVGRLLAGLADAGLAAETLVIVVGDHGEALGEHGEPTHGLLLYEPTLRVPLLVRAPGLLPAGSIVARPVSLVDLSSTAADLLGIGWSAPADGRSGRDLAPALRRGEEPAPADLYAETEYPRLFGWSPTAALRRGGDKFILAPEPELYDLDRDAGESHNLVDAERRTAASLRSALAALRADALDRPTGAADAEAARRLAALGYVSGAVAPARADAADPKRMAPLFTRLEGARQALESGRVAEAARELTSLVAADPGNPVFRGTRALALRRLGDSEAAIADLRTSLGATAADGRTLFDLGSTLHEAGRRSDAETVLRELLRMEPENSEARNLLGLVVLESGRTETAVAEFAGALEVDRNNAIAANNLGNALHALGRDPEAEQAYRRALAIAPEWADPLNGLGVLLVGSSRAGEAIHLFERAFELDGRRFEALLNRAIALDTLGRREEARSAYRDFLERTAREAAYRPQREAARALLARLGG